MDLNPSPDCDKTIQEKKWTKMQERLVVDDEDAASVASSVLHLKDCAAWTVRLAPERQPMQWLLINLLWAGASVTILIDTLLSIHHARARIFAEELYLLYNTTSTAVWCFETCLTVLERRVTQQPLTWPIRIDVCLVLVFFWNSIQCIMAWQVRDVVMSNNAYDTLLNTVAYLYVAYQCWLRSMKDADVTSEIPHKVEVNADVETGTEYKVLPEKNVPQQINEKTSV